MEWIKSCEMMPESNDRILFWVNGFGWEDGYFDGVNWLDIKGNIMNDELIDFWMEILKPSNNR